MPPASYFLCATERKRDFATLTFHTNVQLLTFLAQRRWRWSLYAFTDVWEVVIVGRGAKEIGRGAVIALRLQRSSCAFSDTDTTATGQQIATDGCFPRPWATAIQKYPLTHLAPVEAPHTISTLGRLHKSPHLLQSASCFVFFLFLKSMTDLHPNLSTF